MNFVTGAGGSLSGIVSWPNIYPGVTWGNADIKVPTPIANSHYNFVGWSLEIPSPLWTITNNLTFVANFALDSHTVTYFANGGSGVVPSTGLYTHGQNGVTTKGAGTLYRDGYTFKGWATASGATTVEFAVGSVLNVENDVVLYAVWVQNPETTTTPDVDDPTPTTPATTTEVDGGGDGTVKPANSPKAASNNDVNTSKPLTDLANGNVPLGGFGSIGGWSLLSLIFSVIAVAIAALLLISRRKKEEDEPDCENEEMQTEKNRSRLLKVITIIAGFLTLIVWIILDNFNEPMVWINRNTIFVGVMLIVTLVSFVVYKVRKSDKDESCATE